MVDLKTKFEADMKVLRRLIDEFEKINQGYLEILNSPRADEIPYSKEEEIEYNSTTTISVRHS